MCDVSKLNIITRERGRGYSSTPFTSYTYDSQQTLTLPSTSSCIICKGNSERKARYTRAVNVLIASTTDPVPDM